MLARRQAAHRADAALPQTATANLFRVTGGKVRILGIYGEVTTVIQAQANAIKLISNPTTGADVDLCATLDINAHAAGAMYSITGDLSDAMLYAASGALEVLGDYKPVIVPVGTIDLNAAASNTGGIKWTVLWEPIDNGARVSRYNG